MVPSWDLCWFLGRDDILYVVVLWKRLWVKSSLAAMGFGPAISTQKFLEGLRN